MVNDESFYEGIPRNYRFLEITINAMGSQEAKDEAEHLAEMGKLNSLFSTRPVLEVPSLLPEERKAACAQPGGYVLEIVLTSFLNSAGVFDRDHRTVGISDPGPFFENPDIPTSDPEILQLIQAQKTHDHLETSLAHPITPGRAKTRL